MPLMNKLHYALQALFAVLSPIVVSNAVADDFPGAYVRKQLSDAQRSISIDLRNLANGEMYSVEYVGRPIYIYRRTPADIRHIEESKEAALVDPHEKNIRMSIRGEYGSSSSAVWARLLLLSQPIATRAPYRSANESIAVVAGWSPESGCSLRWLAPKERITQGFVFRDPCTGAQFDAAGRAFALTLTTPLGKRRASSNLSVPPHHVIKGNKLIIGPKPGETVPELDFSRDELYMDRDPTKLLIAAARYNDLETVRSALRAGAKADYFRPGEGSPIDAAVIGSSMEVIKLLVAHGAKLTPNTINGASFVGRHELVEYLKSLPR